MPRDCKEKREVVKKVHNSAAEDGGPGGDDQLASGKRNALPLDIFDINTQKYLAR